MKTKRRKKKKARNSAQRARRPSTKTPPTPVEVLRRKVILDYCRMAADVGPDVSVADLVRTFAPEECWLDKNGGNHWQAKRIWYLRSKGTVGFSKKALAIMARIASDIAGVHDHAFWRLLEPDPLTVPELLEVIQELPSPVAEQLLMASSYTSGEPPTPDFHSFSFDGLRFLGNLDGIAGLLAFGLLCERTYRPEMAREAVNAAVRLLGRTYASMPFAIFMCEIWAILKPSILDKLAPGDFEDRGMQQAWMQASHSYDLVWDACRKHGYTDGVAYADIVKLADCSHLALLADAGGETSENWIIGNPVPLPEPLAILMEAYRKYADLKQAHTSKELFYPRELINSLDSSLAGARRRWDAGKAEREAIMAPYQDAFLTELHQLPSRAPPADLTAPAGIGA